MAIAPLTGAARLRQLLKQPDTILSVPGVFDGFTARLALAQKFDALYMVSYLYSFESYGTLTCEDRCRHIDLTHGMG